MMYCALRAPGALPTHALLQSAAFCCTQPCFKTDIERKVALCKRQPCSAEKECLINSEEAWGPGVDSSVLCAGQEVKV